MSNEADAVQIDLTPEYKSIDLSIRIAIDGTFVNHLFKIRSHRYQPQRNPRHHRRVESGRIAVYYHFYD